MAKLSAALGAAAPAPGTLAVRVDLPPEVVEPVEEALANERAVDLTYLGAVRDEVTHRVVDPLGVVVVDGYGYLRGYCRSAGGLRMFRVDRIRDIHVSPEAAQAVDVAEEIAPMTVALSSTGRRVLVDLPVDSDVLERHPVTARWGLSAASGDAATGGPPTDDSPPRDTAAWVRAELPVGDYLWARRLVLGSAGAVVLREPAWLVDEVLSAAREADRQLPADPSSR